MKVFVDTSAFLAVLNADDDFHQQAAAIWLDLLTEETRLITNSFVLVETYALVQNRLGLDAVRTLAKEILPLFEVKWIDNQFYQQAATSLFAANRQQLSLVDCSSFVTMHQNNIEFVFSFDRHFSEQGFEVLGLKLQ
jgi:predicted nucleic acid-binding protein